MNSLIALNWKLYPSLTDGIVLAPQIKNLAAASETVDIVLCPPAPFISVIYEELKPPSLNLSLGAQDVSTMVEGALTGDVGVKTISPWAKFCIIGHSERRKVYNETSHTVSEKARILIDHNIIPIVCIGEAKQSATAVSFVIDELLKSIVSLSPKEREGIVVAYEPQWAIGGEEAAPVDYAMNMLKKIKEEIPASTRVLYGGTADETNAGDFKETGFDGLLLGRASLKIHVLKEIVEIFAF